MDSLQVLLNFNVCKIIKIIIRPRMEKISTPRSGYMNHKNCFVGNQNVGGNLGTKDSRTIWEDTFMTTYLNPVLSVSLYIIFSNAISFAATF